MRIWVLVLLLVCQAGAEMVQDILVDVPAQRLIANLEKRGAQDAHAQYLLGRVYSLAYAQKLSVLKVEKGKQDPYFGQLDPGFPPQAPAAGDAAARTANLTKAIACFRRAVQLDPENLSARLGLGWCLEQAGDKKGALTQYRRVFAASYAREKAGRTSALLPSMGVETARYLERLLDPKKDAAELAEVKKKSAELAAMPRGVTPVLLPLERGTSFEELVRPAAAVRFDLDGTGARPWGWLTPRAGWLVYRQRERRIKSGLQLLGGVSWWVFWQDGYEAMSALDDDGNGWLEGPELDDLEVWQDADGDGRSRPEELLSLPSLGIVGLRCSGQQHPLGFPYSPGGVRYADGGSGDSYDWMPTSEAPSALPANP